MTARRWQQLQGRVTREILVDQVTYELVLVELDAVDLQPLALNLMMLQFDLASRVRLEAADATLVVTKGDRDHMASGEELELTLTGHILDGLIAFLLRALLGGDSRDHVDIEASSACADEADVTVMLAEPG